MKNIAIYPGGWEASRVSIDGTTVAYFSSREILRSGVTWEGQKCEGLGEHYISEPSGNGKAVAITEEQYAALLKGRELEAAHQMRFATDTTPLVVISHTAGEGKIELVVRIGETELTLKNRSSAEEILANILHGREYCNTNWWVSGHSDRHIETAFGVYNNDGNTNEYRNEGWANAIAAYILENEDAIVAALGRGYWTREGAKQETARREKAQAAQKAAFDAAGPNDLVATDFGYAVEKKNYHKAQKAGFDGIENL